MVDKELTEYEQEVIMRLKAAAREFISPFGKRKGIGQTEFAKKYGFSQTLLSQCLNGKEYLNPHIVEALAREAGIPVTELDPEFNNPYRWERPKKFGQRATPHEGHLLYILEQPDRGIERPIAKIGITNDLSQRIKHLNGGTGFYDKWQPYRVIDLGTGLAKEVESETKSILHDRYDSFKTEVFYCTPAQIQEATIGVIARSPVNTNAMWTIDPSNMSPSVEDEFEEIVKERREYFSKEGLTEDEIDSELDFSFDDPYWWN